MLIDWANIMCFLYFPKVFILDEKYIDVVDLEPREFEFLKEILLHKILPHAKPKGRFIEINNICLNVLERRFLEKVFGEKIIKNMEKIQEGEVKFQRKVKFNVPLIEVTTKCNFNCPHCIQTTEHRKVQDMNLKIALNLIDVFKKHGAVSVDITGGEPSLYNKTFLIKLLEYTAEKDLTVIFSTNGSNIYETLARTLGKMEALTLISLYGFDKKSYAEYTKCVNAYELVIKSIENLHKYNVPIVVRIIYTKLHEKAGYTLEDFVKFVEKIEPEDVQIRFQFAEGWGSGHKDIFSAEVEQSAIKKIKNKLNRLVSNDVRSIKFNRIKKLIEDRVKELMKDFLSKPECPKFGGHGPYITTSGVVLTCPYMDEIVAHISNPMWPVIYMEKLSTKLPFNMKARCLIKHNYLKTCQRTSLIS